MTDQTFLEQFAASYTWSQAPAERRYRFRKRVNRGMEEEHRLALTLGGVINRALDDDEGLQSSDYSTYQIFEADDLVFKLIDLENIKTSRVGYVPRRGIMSPAYIRLQPSSDHTCSKFYYWFFYGAYINNIFNGLGGGVRQNLTPTDLLNFPIPLPDRSTQEAIADFLDRETTRIDELIEKKERLIGLAEVDFINRVTWAVTQGNEEGRATKPASVAWNTSIPATWTTTRLKFLCSRIVDCLHETPEHEEDGEFPSIRTSDVRRGKLLLDTAKRVSRSEYCKRIQRLEPEAGDVVYTREGERFGLAAVVPPETKLCLGQRMMMFRVNGRVVPEYLMWSLNGNFAYNYLKQDIAGATSPHLNIFDIRNVPIFLPPRGEQERICRELGKRFSAKERMTEVIERTLSSLREYRVSLITAAVTGQIDVESWGKRGETDRRLDQIQEAMSA